MPTGQRLERPPRVRRVLDARGRRTWAILALCTGAFIAYISLLPFDFQMSSASDVLASAKQALAFTIESRSNFLANIVLGVPLGFFCAGAAGAGTRRSMFVLALLLGACGVLSASIEFLQILVPSRTPTLSDVIAQQIGVLVGIAVWFVAGPSIAESLQPATGRQRAAIERLLAAYSVCYLLSLMAPLDVTVSVSRLAEKYRRGGIVLVPFQAEAAGDGRVSQAFAASLVLWVPVGMFTAIAGMPRGSRRSFAKAGVTASVVVMAAELGQVLVVSRVADTTDVLSGTAGVWLGAGGIATLSNRTTTATALAARSRFAMLGLGAAACCWIVYQWAPFDFSTDPEMIKGRLRALSSVPFLAYYQTPEGSALEGVLTKFLMATPLGFFAASFARTTRIIERSGLVLIALALGAFFVGVELGQILLPARLPEVGDMVVAIVGASAGAGVARTAWQ